MAVRGQELDDRLAPLLRDGRDLVGYVAWFDAHTHMGHNDPDGFEADPEEIVAGLDHAGHARALIFAMHEPAGYGEANDAVLAATRRCCARWSWRGRRRPVCPRADPGPGPCAQSAPCA